MGGYYTLFSKAYGPDEVGDVDLPDDTVEQIAFGFGELDEDGIAQFDVLCEDDRSAYIGIVWTGDPPKMYSFNNGQGYDISLEEAARRMPLLAAEFGAPGFRKLPPSEFCALLERHGFTPDTD